MLKKVYGTILVCIALAAVGCGGDGGGGGGAAPDGGASPPETGGRVLEPIDPGTVGTIRGKILFLGTPPKMGRIDTEADEDCHALRKDDPLYRETVVVNENGTLKDVIVYVKKGLSGFEIPAPPDTPVILDQVGCRYVPHTLAIRAGQTIEVRNNDPTMHNVHFVSRLNGEWNLSQKKGETKQRKGDDGVLRREMGTSFFKCDVHSWMKANVGVFDHPFYDVTGETGEFELTGLPPGDYTIMAWHERYKTLTEAVTLAPSQSLTLEFTYDSD